MDTRQLTRGTTLYLPVQVDGALFSCGDAHAAQGDGEVCVTGLESPMYGALRFTLHKDRPIPAPQYLTGGPLAPARGRRRRGTGRPASAPTCSSAPRRRCGRWSTISPASTASRREDAYLLCSLCVDLRISEIVDAGQYVVSALLPLAIFSDA